MRGREGGEREKEGEKKTDLLINFALQTYIYLWYLSLQLRIQVFKIRNARLHFKILQR